MGYYRGDYYRGDYYRGDPFLGFIGKAIGSLAKGAVNVGRALLGGSAAAPINITPPVLYNAPAPGPAFMPASGSIPTFMPQLPQVPQGTPGSIKQPGLGGVINRLLPFGDSGYVLPGTCDIKGHHLNKSTYVVRGGGTSRYGDAGQMLLIPKGTTCVKNRRMNVTNPRALRRAIRRSRGAVKLLRKAATSIGYSVVTKASLARRPKARRR